MRITKEKMIEALEESGNKRTRCHYGEGRK